MQDEKPLFQPPNHKMEVGTECVRSKQPVSGHGERERKKERVFHLYREAEVLILLGQSFFISKSLLKSPDFPNISGGCAARSQACKKRLVHRKARSFPLDLCVEAEKGGSCIPRTCPSTSFKTNTKSTIIKKEKKKRSPFMGCWWEWWRSRGSSHLFHTLVLFRRTSGQGGPFPPQGGLGWAGRPCHWF